MHSHSFQDTRVQTSQVQVKDFHWRQVVEGLTILRYLVGLRN